MKLVNNSAAQIFTTTKDLASRWHSHEETIRRMLRRGDLPSVIINRRRLILMEDVIAAEQAGRIRIK